MNTMGTGRDLLIAILLSAWSSARGEADALARLNGEYPHAARQLEERFSSVKGVCRLRVVQPEETKPETNSDANFAVAHGYEKVVIRRKVSGRGVDAVFGEFIYCVGSGTGPTFYLSRKPGADSYFVEGIGSTAADRSAYVTLFGRFANAHYGVFGQPLSRLMRTPGFRIIGAEYTTEGDAGLIKAKFEVGDQDPKSTISVVFDPGDGWNIRSSEFRAGKPPGGVRITTDVSYGPAREGGPSLPRRVVARDASGVTSICEFVDWKFESTPEAEFKMGFYNLPDLVSASSTRSRLHLYVLLGIAAVAFAAALALRRHAFGSAG